MLAIKHPKKKQRMKHGFDTKNIKSTQKEMIGFSQK